MREKWIDTVKATAVFFVMLGHAGVKIPLVSDFAVLFYVPVFFVLAGYLHHHRETETYGAYVRRRAKRLLVPYFGYSLFLLLFSMGKEFLSGSFALQKVLESVWGILFGVNTTQVLSQVDAPFTPLLNIWNAPLWFLPALFLAEILFEGMCRIGKNSPREVFLGQLGCLGIGVFAHYGLPFRLPWSFDQVLILEMFLAVGAQLRYLKAMKWFAKYPAWMAVLILFAGVIRWKNGPINLSLGIWGLSLLFGMLACLSASVAWMALWACLDKWIPEGLAILGQNTLPILCLHLFVFLFAQTAIGWLVPGFMSKSGIGYDVLKIAMVILTMDVLSIGNLAYKKWAQRLEQRKEHV